MTVNHRAANKPPPLPRRLYATIQESAAEAAEKLRSALAAKLLDEGELERFKNLIVFARTMVESRFQGRHKSPDLGGGGEFSEYVTYEPGHPVQAIDWRVFARDNKPSNFRFRPLGPGDCISCHYGEFSRPFEWDKFWPDVAHGKDAQDEK